MLGAAALFCLALGMGAPLLAVGASAGTLLPRSGPWMDAVKTAFGFMMLATALSFVSPFLPIAVQMGLWAILLIVPAILLRAIDPLPPHAETPHRLFKALGILAAAGRHGRNGWRRIFRCARSAASTRRTAPRRAGSDRDAANLHPHPLAGGSRRTVEIRRNAGDARFLCRLVAFSCKEMERYTFADPRVREALAGWTLLHRPTSTANTPDDQALLARFRLFGPPGILFFNANGQQVGSVRVVGFQNAERFLDTLRAIPH